MRWRVLAGVPLLLFVAPAPAAHAAVPVLVIDGKGWGHGVGMAQNPEIHHHRNDTADEESPHDVAGEVPVQHEDRERHAEGEEAARDPHHRSEDGGGFAIDLAMREDIAPPASSETEAPFWISGDTRVLKLNGAL